MQLFLLKDGQQLGPYSVDDINGMLEAEQITGEDLCWFEGCEAWVPLSQFPGFIPAPSSRPMPPPPPSRLEASLGSTPTMTAKPKKRLNGCLIAAASIVGLGILSVGGCIFLGTSFVSSVNHKVEAQAKQVQDTTNERIKSLETATPSDLRPDGDLEKQFQLFSNYTDLQRENAENRIKGAVVQWTLTVFDIRAEGDHYRVQTSDTDKVDAFISLYARNDADKDRINALRTGDPITFRGYVSGISFPRHIEIDPAVLVP